MQKVVLSRRLTDEMLAADDPKGVSAALAVLLQASVDWEEAVYVALRAEMSVRTSLLALSFLIPDDGLFGRLVAELQPFLVGDGRNAVESVADRRGADGVEARRRELRSMPYKDYLRTEEWAARRAEAIGNAFGRCRVCNAEGPGLEVHHRTYERRGNEAPGDLTVLCAACHGLYHQHDRIKRGEA